MEVTREFQQSGSIFQNLSSISQVYCESISSKPVVLSAIGQAPDFVGCPSKRRITVDSAKRAKLTEYFYSHNGKVSPKEASQMFSIGFENCRKLLRKLHKGEQIVGKPMKRKYSSKLLPEHDAFIEKLILDNPKISNQSIANFLQTLQHNPINVSRSTIRRHRQQLMCNFDSTQAEGSTEESPFDNLPFEFDSYSYDFGMINDQESHSSSFLSYPFDCGFEETWR